jgi:hypothetical protein
MSSPINDGGPAFPHDIQELGNAHRTAQPGMTLRDWFAGQALAGWLASYGESACHPVSDGAQADSAAHAYEMADAMIAAREGGAA